MIKCVSVSRFFYISRHKRICKGKRPSWNALISVVIRQRLFVIIVYLLKHKFLRALFENHILNHGPDFRWKNKHKSNMHHSFIWSKLEGFLIRDIYQKYSIPALLQNPKILMINIGWRFWKLTKYFTMYQEIFRNFVRQHYCVEELWNVWLSEKEKTNVEMG